MTLSYYFSRKVSSPQQEIVNSPLTSGVYRQTHQTFCCRKKKTLPKTLLLFEYCCLNIALFYLGIFRFQLTLPTTLTTLHLKNWNLLPRAESTEPCASSYKCHIQVAGWGWSLRWWTLSSMTTHFLRRRVHPHPQNLLIHVSFVPCLQCNKHSDWSTAGRHFMMYWST